MPGREISCYHAQRLQYPMHMRFNPLSIAVTKYLGGGGFRRRKDVGRDLNLLKVSVHGQLA